MTGGGQARSIETVEDVRDVLESGFASFPELLECVERAKAMEAWELVEQAGTALLLCSTGRPRKALPSLQGAALAIVASYLASVTTLETLGPELDRAAEAFGRVTQHVGRSGPAAEAAKETGRWLDDLRVLYADPRAPSLILLCSKLREIDRPDLGIEAATRALELESRGVPVPSTRSAALNTRAAALLDQGNHPRALADIMKASKLMPGDSYVLNTYARALIAAGQPDQALDKAQHAFRLSPNEYSAHSLLAAAAAAHDEDAMAEAKEFIAAHPSAEGMTQNSTWVEVVATGILLDHGQLNEAAAAIHRLENDPRAAPQQLRDLKRRLMTLRKKQQRQLEL